MVIFLRRALPYLYKVAALDHEVLQMQGQKALTRYGVDESARASWTQSNGHQEQTQSPALRHTLITRWNVQFLYPTGSPFFLHTHLAKACLRLPSRAKRASKGRALR